MKANLLIHLKSKSLQKTFPDNTVYDGISIADVKSTAKQYDKPQREIEIFALNNGIVPERYVRNMKSFSPKDQSLLLRKTVCIVGLGGLGGGVVEILARLGIGRLILIDGDRFEDSNLNRQLISSENEIGTSKAIAAAKRVSEINSSVQAPHYFEFLTEQNAPVLFQNADVIVDCLDSIKTRFYVETAAKNAGIPLVSGAVAGSTGQVTTIFPEDKGLRAIYGDPGQLPEKGIETVLGTLSFAVTLVSTLESAEVIKILLQKGDILRNKLLIVNPLDNLYEIMRLF